MPGVPVAVGNRGLAVVTDDGGKTWKEVKLPRSEVANKLLQVRGLPRRCGLGRG
jgi:photosystem II stability/assembly factor-like uncharacterized protein